MSFAMTGEDETAVAAGDARGGKFHEMTTMHSGLAFILPRELLARRGMTLDQLGAWVASRGHSSQAPHAGDETLDACRDTAGKIRGYALASRAASGG